MESNPVEIWSKWSDVFNVLGLICGGLVALVAIIGWGVSWKAGRLKDEALKRFQIDATKTIAEADTKAAEANKIAAIANEGQTKANERSVILEKELITARFELEKLRKSQKPRIITESQTRDLIEVLSHNAKGKIIIQSEWLDVEAKNLSEQIKSILSKSGHQILPVSLQVLSVTNYGIVMCIKDKEIKPHHVNIIYGALTHCGFDVTYYENSSLFEKGIYDDGSSWVMDCETIIIWVCKKL